MSFIFIYKECKTCIFSLWIGWFFPYIVLLNNLANKGRNMSEEIYLSPQNSNSENMAFALYFQDFSHFQRKNLETFHKHFAIVFQNPEKRHITRNNSQNDKEIIKNDMLFFRWGMRSCVHTTRPRLLFYSRFFCQGNYHEITKGDFSWHETRDLWFLPKRGVARSAIACCGTRGLGHIFLKRRGNYPLSHFALPF